MGKSTRLKPEEEKLWKAEISVTTRGFNKEDARENLRKSIVVFDDLLSDIEEETLDHLNDRPFIKERVKKTIWRELKRK